MKEAIKEREGTSKDLDCGILNRSMSEAVMRIFTDIRDRDKGGNNSNSPMRIFEGKKESVNTSQILPGRLSRNSTTSAKKKN